ncbi:MAG: cation:proton antiporter [Sulfurovum sp.]|nr:cation:proton antiporter [Sulfurovum sp.]
MQTEITLLLTISLIIWGAPFIAKLVRIPTIPIEIMLGSILAFAGLLQYHEYFDIVAEVGFLYLMFLAGMEVDLKQITKSPKSLIQKAMLFIVTLGALALGSGILLDLNIIVIISLPLISIGILASLSKSYGKDEEWIKLAFIVGVLGEIISIAALTVVDAVSSVGFGLELFIKLGYLFLFILGIYLLYRMLHLLFWWYPELKTALLPKMDTSDQDVRLSIALFFILISLMLVLDLELALGTFIAGVAISAFFHHEKRLEEKMSSLGFGFLVPLFFIHVGASFDLIAVTYPGVVSGALLITGLMIGIRLIAGVYLKSIYGSRVAILTSLSLSMPLTLLIAVATIGHNVSFIDTITYYQLILASLFEVIISMLAIKLLSKKLNETKIEDQKHAE